MNQKVTIYNKINNVRKKVAYIQKDTKVQGYKAVTHDMVTASLRDACVEEGILIIPDEIESRSLDVGQTSSGTTIIRYEAKYTITFISTEDGSQLQINLQAHANDHGDKAPGKALSYAVKNAMLKVFMLETGESDESRVEPARRKKVKIQPDQVEWINDQLKEKGIDIENFTGYLKKNRCNSIEEINEDFFPMVEDLINKHKGGDNA